MGREGKPIVVCELRLRLRLSAQSALPANAPITITSSDQVTVPPIAFNQTQTLSSIIQPVPWLPDCLPDWLAGWLSSMSAGDCAPLGPIKRAAGHWTWDAYSPQSAVRSPLSPHSLEDGSVMTIWFACNASAIIMAKVTSGGINLARPGAAVATTTRAGHHAACSIELQLQCTMAQSAILHKCHYCCRWLCRLPLSQTDWQLNWKVWRHFSLFDLLPVARSPLQLQRLLACSLPSAASQPSQRYAKIGENVFWHLAGSITLVYSS